MSIIKLSFHKLSVPLLSSPFNFGYLDYTLYSFRPRSSPATIFGGFGNSAHNVLSIKPHILQFSINSSQKRIFQDEKLCVLVRIFARKSWNVISDHFMFSKERCQVSPHQFIGVLFVLFCPIGFTEQISNAHKIVTGPVYAGAVNSFKPAPQQ